MDFLLTPSSIMFMITMFSIGVNVFLYFRNPQEALDKRTAVDKEETEGKANILAQQLQWEKEATEKKFNEMGIRLDKAFELAQNHTHTIDVKCDRLIESVALLSITVAKLETVINERIPSHK